MQIIILHTKDQKTKLTQSPEKTLSTLHKDTKILTKKSTNGIVWDTEVLKNIDRNIQEEYHESIVDIGLKAKYSGEIALVSPPQNAQEPNLAQNLPYKEKWKSFLSLYTKIKLKSLHIELTIQPWIENNKLDCLSGFILSKHVFICDSTSVGMLYHLNYPHYIPLMKRLSGKEYLKMDVISGRYSLYCFNFLLGIGNACGVVMNRTDKLAGEQYQGEPYFIIGGQNTNNNKFHVSLYLIYKSRYEHFLKDAGRGGANQQSFSARLTIMGSVLMSKLIFIYFNYNVLGNQSIAIYQEKYFSIFLTINLFEIINHFKRSMFLIGLSRIIKIFFYIGVFNRKPIFKLILELIECIWIMIAIKTINDIVCELYFEQKFCTNIKQHRSNKIKFKDVFLT